MDALARSRTGLLMMFLTALSFAEGCRAVEGIFKAGFWVGIIIAVVVIGIVFAVVRAIAS